MIEITFLSSSHIEEFFFQIGPERFKVKFSRILDGKRPSIYNWQIEKTHPTHEVIDNDVTFDYPGSTQAEQLLTANSKIQRILSQWNTQKVGLGAI